ncbi:vitelline membrane outer layer protein 1 homolog [Mixophyes fleayi]|uniref:vitelline membrane outer layer protein 1 homolog n=1 Tax=Mixophyes fleayi TaxID=3061075 RepID=UPI003F4E1B2E
MNDCNTMLHQVKPLAQSLMMMHKVEKQENEDVQTLGLDRFEEFKDAFPNSYFTAFHYPEDMLMSLAVSLVLILQTTQISAFIISVDNGAEWGKWGEMEKCPHGSVAKGFSLKVQPPQGTGDDTAVNGVRLHCVRCKHPHNETTITSDVAPWGNWTEPQWCNFGVLSKFIMRVEGDQGRGDDTAVDNIKFQCSDGKEMEGPFILWGQYGKAWSESCTNGISGLKTKVQGKEQDGVDDNTGLNDVQFYCSKSAND